MKYFTHTQTNWEPRCRTVVGRASKPAVRCAQLPRMTAKSQGNVLFAFRWQPSHVHISTDLNLASYGSSKTLTDPRARNPTALLASVQQHLSDLHAISALAGFVSLRRFLIPRPSRMETEVRPQDASHKLLIPQCAWQGYYDALESKLKLALGCWGRTTKWLAQSSLTSTSK